MELYDRGPDRLGYTERDFKVCDLCGALNPVTNEECFVCSWSGRFHTDRETIGEAMRMLERHYGAVDESLFSEDAIPSTPPKVGFWAGLWESVRRLFSRRQRDRGYEFDFD